jgi:hypothetical protein
VGSRVRLSARAASAGCEVPDRERRAGVHRRPPSVQSCCVLTGPLRPVDGLPALLGGALLHDYYESSATPRRQQRTVRLPQTPTAGSAGTAGALHTFTHRPVGRVGAQLYPGGHRHALPQHGARPRPPEQQTVGRDGPQRKRGPSAPTAHSRQFRGCCPVSGLLTLVRLLRLSALLPHPARWRRTVARSSRAACRPPPHLRHQAAPQLHPTVTAAGGRVSHPTRSYGASWRSATPDDDQASDLTGGPLPLCAYSGHVGCLKEMAGIGARRPQRGRPGPACSVSSALVTSKRSDCCSATIAGASILAIENDAPERRQPSRKPEPRCCFVANGVVGEWLLLPAGDGQSRSQDCRGSARNTTGGS